MSQLVFGSSGAKEILQKDRELRQREKRHLPLREFALTIEGQYVQEVIVHARTKAEAIERFDNREWESESEKAYDNDYTWLLVTPGKNVEE